MTIPLPAGPPRFLTPDDLAAILAVPKATLYSWRCGDDPIPALKLGKHLRFEWAQVELWLDRRRDPASCPTTRAILRKKGER